MAVYQVPLEDIRFVLHDVVGAESLNTLPGYEDVSTDIIDAILEEAAKFCEQELWPLNKVGDEEGCTFENGVVRTPKGFKELYDKFCEGGWSAFSCDPKYGGQGLPYLLHCVVEEIMSSANLSFAICPGLSHGAYRALELYASEELKDVFLPPLTDGRFSGTMCLTEAHCGTDLGMIKTKAIPVDARDDSPFAEYKITGSKIFISAGEQDLTENILHLVLAKLPDAPEGTKGISLFLVPKFMVNPDGSLGKRNNVACGSIEHKMGIHGSPTCVINLDSATGYLIGEKHGGMKAMFVMMNAARLAVGIEGYSQSEIAYQSALTYAKERLQGRSLKGAQNPDQPADPIIVHPDVRRMLLSMKAFNEGARAFAYLTGYKLDIAKKHEDATLRQEADDWVSLVTPIIKAYFTDMGLEASNMGLQVFGGHGYIKEWGIEQIVRDVRITQLYEGANGIQALDLVGRKLSVGMGRLLRQFFHPVQEFIDAHKDHPQLGALIQPYAKTFEKLQQVTLLIAQKSMGNPEEAGAASTDYLKAFALVALGYMWLLMAKTAFQKIAAGETTPFLTGKLKTAQFFMAKLLPQASTHLLAITSGAKPLMDFNLDEF